MTDVSGGRVTMTFLFTDIEGSTRLWERHPEDAPDLIERHDRIVEAAVEGQGGSIFHRAGDGMIAHFEDETAAVLAAIAAQRALGDESWNGFEPVRVRMGVHTGSVVVRPEGPYGWALNFGTRLTDVGHGGQILLSDAARAGLESTSGDAVGEVRSLGERRLRDIARPACVFQLVVPDLDLDFPELRPAGPNPPPLPRSRSPLIGRGADVASIEDALRQTRHVTIAGPSGVGKSRIAIEVAHRLGRDTSDGTVVWCDLSGVRSDAIAESVMTAHSVARRPGRSAISSLAEWLADIRAVLVLDQCDECFAGVVDLVDALVEWVPEVTVLCVSQRPLSIRGEVVHRVAPMPIDEAVALFEDRARAVGVVEVDRDAASEVCLLLDRMPFAIEIIAANAAVSTLDDMLMSLSSGGLAAVAGEHAMQSVENAIVVVLGALNPFERECFSAATVFPGSFDRAMFAAVCGLDADDVELTDTLVQLVDASLLQPEPASERAVFRILDPVRTYASSIADGEIVRRATDALHEFAVRFSAQVASGLRGAEERRWLLALDRNFDTLRFVLDRAVATGDVTTASRLASELWEWAFFHYNSEYFAWGRRVLAACDPDDPRLSLVHGVVALGHWFSDELDATFLHAEAALRLERERDADFSLPARLALINATVFAGATAPPAEIFEQAAAWQRERSEPFYRVNVEAQNAMMATWLGQHDAAERRAVRCLKTARASRNPSSVAYALWVLGQAIEHDDPERAEHLLDDAVQQARDVDNQWVTSLAQTGLASIRRRTAGPIEAAPVLLGLLDQLTRAGHWAQFWNVVRLSALVVAEVGESQLAFQLAAAVDAATMTFPSLPEETDALAGVVASIRDQRGEAWATRTARIASTWDLPTVASAARGGLEAALA